MGEARTITDLEWTPDTAVSDPKTPSALETFRNSLLRRMDQETARSFTEAQLHELERVLASSTSGCPPVDVRITVPFFRRRYFITVLAGPERRPAKRLKAERVKHTIWTFANVCFFGFLLALSIPAMIGLFHIFTVTG